MLKVSTLHRRLVMNDIMHFNLTTPQYLALLVVSDAPEGCTMSELALATHQVSATTTGIVHRLVEHNLVERRVNPADRRSRRVFITEDGKRLLAKVVKKREAHMLAVLDQYTSEERQTLISLLHRYVDAASEPLE